MFAAFRDQKAHYLTLDDVYVNPALARRLPPELAFRYHALPIAEEQGYVTVAMAHPEDTTARQVVATALHEDTYVVQSDETAIERLLAEVWPEAAQAGPRLLVCCQHSPQAEQVQRYANAIGQLLHGRLTRFSPEDEAAEPMADLAEAARQNADLVILGESAKPSFFKRLFNRSAARRVVDCLETSFLLAQGPRWPLKNILLVTRGQTGVDYVAVDWVVRLAQPSQARVTVLALTPDIPALCQRAMTHMPNGLVDWLSSETPLGRQLCAIAGRLENWEIEGRLHFRQGSPLQQIQSEIEANDYDLVVLAADPPAWWDRRLLGGLVKPLSDWIKQPLLVAKTPAQE